MRNYYRNEPTEHVWQHLELDKIKQWTLSTSWPELSYLKIGGVDLRENKNEFTLAVFRMSYQVHPSMSAGSIWLARFSWNLVDWGRGAEVFVLRSMCKGFKHNKWLTRLNFQSLHVYRLTEAHRACLTAFKVRGNWSMIINVMYDVQRNIINMINLAN